jgi:beta-glucosidase
VGIVQSPISDRPADVEAARAKMFAVPPKLGWTNSWWLDPVLLGRYPEEGLRSVGSDAPEVREGDLELISEATDFLGVNVYQGGLVRAGDGGAPEEVPRPQGHPLTGFDWWVAPESLYWGPRYLHERYGKPILITENGLSCRDWVSVDEQVHDPQRIDFVTRYLRELHRAVTDGVPVQGYLHWSLLDNFEWAEGYKQRFGLVYVDYPSQKRILKDSALWYRDVIASNGARALE